tara:strand:- start:3316 stop:3594 length:279 start_codon:yes stop_codon:yes gene_type:complete
VRVRATKKGFFGSILRYPGDKFECGESLFSKRWMEKVGGASAPPAASPIRARATDELKEARAEYKSVFGKRPGASWDEAKIRAKIEAALEPE